MTLPIYFAWVTETDTTFTASMRRMDEDILAFKRTLAENQFPTLSLTIRNPRRGLLLGDTWAWLVYNGAGTEVPLFFGRVQGLPDALDQETITIKLIARSLRWRTLKQSVAETLKQQDGYDPVFIDAGSRDDPDAIIEGFSGAYHYAHIPTDSPADLAVTFSDLIDAEDGTILFYPDEILYENFNFKIGEQPLVFGGVRADVKWIQRSAGTIDIGRMTFPGNTATYSPTQYIVGYSGAVSTGQEKTVNIFGSSGVLYNGSSLIGSWPKPGSQLAGGYTVHSSYAFDTSGAEHGSPFQHQSNWENMATSHKTGDTMSINTSWTEFPCGGELNVYDVQSTVGIIDPEASLTPGGPKGVNIPAHASYSETLICAWIVATSLVLDYQANRPHTEYLDFKLQTDVQSVLADPAHPASLDSEIQMKPGADVSAPVFNVLSWYSVFLQGTVDLGQVVKSTPDFAVQPIYSIAVATSGAVGATEPAWSNELGVLVTDGGVTWASLGFNLPGDIVPWKTVANANVIVGTIIRAETFLAPPLDLLGFPFPAVSAGTQSFQMCVQAGTTQHYTSPTFDGIADLRPSYPQPLFSAVKGVQTADGSAIWVSLGSGLPVMEIPLGLDPSQDDYFPTDRGARSIRTLVMMERAKMRARARSSTTSWESPFEKVIDLTCRMSAQCFDDRLPGQSATGKIIQTEIEFGGDTAPIGRVTIASCLGKGTESTTPLIDGDYGDVDWDDGYQVDIGLTEASSFSNDIYYSLPVFGPDADGVTFPILDRSQVIVREAVFYGTPPGSAAVVPGSFQTVTTTTTTTGPGISASQATTTEYVVVPNGYMIVQIPVVLSSPFTGIVSHSTSIDFKPLTQYYLELKPLDGMSFTKQYNIETSILMLPNQIDTEAPSLS